MNVRSDEQKFEELYKKKTVPYNYMNVIRHMLHLLTFGKAHNRGVLKKFIERILFLRTDIKAKGSSESDILIVDSPTSMSGTHRISYENFASLFPDACTVYIREYKKVYSIKDIFNNIIFSFRFIRILRRNGISLIASLVAVDRCFVFRELENTLNGNLKAKLAFVYFDLSEYDACASEYLMKYNVPVATLQHGGFIAPRDKSRYEYCGLELEYNFTDYFFVWNNYYKDQAIKAGQPEGKIIVAGIPKYINYDIPEIEHDGRNRILGITLNSDNLMDENIALISYAIELAEEFDLDILVKFHPTARAEKYRKLLDNKHVRQMLPLKMDLTEYCGLVDFTIMSNSSTFNEIVYLKQTVFKYDTGPDDKYMGLETESFFTDYDSLRQLYIRYRDGFYDTKMYDQLCTITDPAKAYRSAAEQIISGTEQVNPE